MSKILWTQKQDIGPKPRVQHALAYDFTTAHTILFGGKSLSGEIFGDTWGWDGENWTQFADIGPHARASHALAHDWMRKRTVLFGGHFGGASVGDTWGWDGTDWAQLEDTGPAPRSGHAMVFDSVRGRVILFGGGPTGGAALGDTWEWDGTEWVQTQDTGPGPRRNHAMAFDPGFGKTILFGGLGGPGPTALADTWEYDVNKNWTQVEDIGPAACFGSGFVFTIETATLYGGASGLSGAPPPVVFGVTWEWDRKVWTARQDIGPGPRVGHAIAYDPARSRVVLFGGADLPLDDPAAAGAVHGDTWEQFDATAASGSGSGPTLPGVQKQLAAFTIKPSVAVPGDTVTFEVTLTGPADLSGQVVPITDSTTNPIISVPVAASATTGQAQIHLDTDLGSTMTLPVAVDCVATAGNVSKVAQLIINP